MSSIAVCSIKFWLPQISLNSFVRKNFQSFELSVLRMFAFVSNAALISFPETTLWSKKIKASQNKCDQIWWNFLHFSEILKIFGVFYCFILKIAKFWTYFGNFLCCWARIHCCKGPNIEGVIKPSGHICHNGPCTHWYLSYMDLFSGRRWGLK